MNANNRGNAYARAKKPTILSNGILLIMTIAEIANAQPNRFFIKKNENQHTAQRVTSGKNLEINNGEKKVPNIEFTIYTPQG